MKPVEHTFELDNSVENANWIKNGTWDLPPYGSKEFFQVINYDQLDWFRGTVTYKAAVAKGLIYDDEWVANYVVDPTKEFVNDLYDAIKSDVKKRDETFDGILDAEYREGELSENEMLFNRNIIALSNEILTMPDHDDTPGLRITGKACAATLTAVTNYDIDPNSRAADHARAYDLHVVAGNYYGEGEIRDAHLEIAGLHDQARQMLIGQGEIAKVVIDNAAHEAATSPNNDKPEPTDAQKEAGNYEKGHINIGGLSITIENPAGSKRKPQWPTLQSHYGYIRSTIGADDEHIDCFVKPGTDSEYAGPVFVVDQVNKDGTFDEHKCLIGFASKKEAVKAYMANFTPDWNLGEVTEFTWTDFKAWCAQGPHKNPVSSK